MTDINEYQTDTSRIREDNNSSFILNQSNVPMDVDIDDDDLIPSASTKINGYKSSHTIEDENDDEHVFHQGNPALNKSFDILPQIKDDNAPSIDPVEDNSETNTNVLDTTVELPNNNDEFEEKPSQDLNILKPVNSMNTPPNAQSFLPNQFSVEYPFVIPQPEVNQPSSPSNSVETVTTLTKNMKLNVNKTSEGQEPSASASTTDKTFDTNTFVLKKKERRKVTTPATEKSFHTTVEETPPSDLYNKQSPPVSLDVAATSRPVTASQQSFIDPTRIM